MIGACFPDGAEHPPTVLRGQPRTVLACVGKSIFQGNGTRGVLDRAHASTNQHRSRPRRATGASHGQRARPSTRAEIGLDGAPPTN
jgi:hypothetical protein